MNNDSFFCEDLYYSLCEFFEKDPTKYRIKTWDSIKDTLTVVEILPKGFYDVINNLNGLQHKEYLSTLKLGFNDKGQQIVIRLRENKDGAKYVVLKVYSKTNYADIYVGKETEQWHIIQGSLKRNVLIYNSKDIYIANSKGNSFYSAKVSDFKYAPIEISQFILSRYSEGSMIWKDFLSESFFPPIMVNELSQHHNKKEFFEKQFNVDLPNSVNKLPFLKTYAACCAKDYIIPEQIPFLFYDTEEIDFDFLPNKRNKKDIAAKYLKLYIRRKNMTANKDVISDYVDFSMTLKEPIDILAGKKKISEYHNMLTDRIIQKANHGKKLVIPETPLKYLTLPKEFHLLTTKKALMFEGKRNHNCVGAYVNIINNGKCVVYAADINGEHLTIDIRYKKSRKKNKTYDFYVNQCYTTYNKNCKQETLRYVKECVERSSDKAIEKYTVAIA